MAQQISTEVDKFSKGARSSSNVSLLFLNEKQLEKYDKGKEDEVIKGLIEKSISRRFIFSKWTDAYFENQDKLSQQSTNFNAPCDVRNYDSSNESLQYSFASCTKEENISDADTAKRIFEELVSNHDNPEVNLIILAINPSGLKIAQKLFTFINESQDKKKYCLWGGETYGIVEAENKEFGENLYKKPIFMGIRMFHSAMKSWSLIADFRKFKEELIKFKKNVQLKRYSLGFISGRSAMVHQEMYIDCPGLQPGNSNIVRSSDFVDIVKSYFPDTPLLGGFNLGLSEIYGYNSMEEDAGVITNKLAVSFMIITHD